MQRLGWNWAWQLLTHDDHGVGQAVVGVVLERLQQRQQQLRQRQGHRQPGY